MRTLLNYLGMTKKLVCLIPWMVVTAAWGAPATPANLAYTFSGDTAVPAARIEEQCWVPLKSVESFGWKVRERGEMVDLDAEGRVVRTPSRSVNGEVMISASEVANQLGAVTSWEGSTFRVLGQVRTIDFIGSSIRIDSTLPFRKTAHIVGNPNRLVLDLQGAALPPEGRFQLPLGVRMGQFRPDTLRIVIENPEIRLPRTSRPGSTRWLDLSLAPFKFPENIIDEPPFLPLESQGAGSLGNNDLQPQPQPNSATILPAPRVKTSDLIEASIRSVSDRADLLEFKLNAALPSASTVVYETPNLLVLTLAAKPTTAVNFSNLKGKYVDKVQTTVQPNGQTVVQIHTKRALTFELASSGTVIAVKLQVPKNSDGRLAGKTIVVDAGHGGADSGAIWPQRTSKPAVMEKTLALAVSRLIAKDLTDQGANVILTRNSDVRLTLAERPEVANRNNAAMLVSVHINSSSVADKATGTITFYHMRNPDGMLLAKCIQDEIVKVSGLPNTGVWSDSRIYNSGFAVLRMSKVPSVLLELGFVNHQRDRAAMIKPEWQQRVASAIVKGIKVYLGDVKETPNP